jgi:hypothetical protein
MLNLMLLEKQKQAKPKNSQREMIKIRAKINKIKTQKKLTKEKVGSSKRLLRLMGP